MCGIAGIISLDAPSERETVVMMASALHHRGVDSRGVFSSDGVALAATRLAITDPGFDGNQPMSTTDGRLTLVFNGEIYNHLELRKKLSSQGIYFRTGTDTEVVLNAFAFWGEACVTQFNGMWSFAIWDRRINRLFCSRDRFGEKPFYYYCDGKRFVFASEIKALCEDPKFQVTPNLSAIRDFLQFERIDHSNETFFAGVRTIEAGNNLTFDASGLKYQRYWSLRPEIAPPDHPIDALREAFIEAVRLRTETTAPLGYCLSGGLDSSSIVGVASRLRPHLCPWTFTAAFGDINLDERPYAQAVVETVGARPHWIAFDARDLVNHLPAIVRTHDEPFNSVSMAAQWFVMRSAHDHGRKVMIDGQGADELFAGYDSMFGRRFLDMIIAGQIKNLAREFIDFRKIGGGSCKSFLVGLGRAMIPIDIERSLRARVLNSQALVGNDLKKWPILDERDTPGFPDNLRMMLSKMMFGHGIPELFHSLDRNAMAHGIEARAPYLDHRLVQMAFSLSGEFLISKGRTKACMRDAMSHMLPEKVKSRSLKLSYNTPQSRFFREDLGRFAKEVFASPSFSQRGWFSAVHCRKLLDYHMRFQIDAGYQLWRVLNLELWAREFIDRRPTGC